MGFLYDSCITCFPEVGDGWDLARGFETPGQDTQKKILAEGFIQTFSLVNTSEVSS